MSIWQIFGRLAVSTEGETIQRLNDTTSVSSDGITFTRMGSTTVGSDGSTFTQMGNFSTDGSTRMGNVTTGIGSVFNQNNDLTKSSSSHKFGYDDDDDFC